MSSIEIKEGVIKLTEQTVRELLRAVEDSRALGRDEVMVESPYSGISFVVHNEIKPHTQESLRYNKVSVRHGNKLDEIQVVPASEPAQPEWIDIKMANKIGK